MSKPRALSAEAVWPACPVCPVPLSTDTVIDPGDGSGLPVMVLSSAPIPRKLEMAWRSLGWLVSSTFP